ncbi:hypothetical protein [Merismopedia glauca]|uniref:hypothetical protein n=1 Tax=Merismopedia glauca TaxID=292586 RepID=UPI0011B1C629|nr:hypothetical protein [Merismopedia glauca]
MSLFQIGEEIVGNLGFRTVKNIGKVVFGAGQAVIGMVNDDSELVEAGMKNVGKGGIGLGISAVGQMLGGDPDEENQIEDIDLQ